MKIAAQCTPEARGLLKDADVVFTVVDGLTQYWLEKLNPNVQSLAGLYGNGRTRRETYNAMTETILEGVRRGSNVVAAFYGHPGVFVDPAHAAIRIARDEGFDAAMLPGVSAEDCMFADLGFDPGRVGCQSYEATDFVINNRRFDPNAALILWQIAVVGDTSLLEFSSDPRRLKILVSILAETYALDHSVVVYEAATLPITKPRIDRRRLDELPHAEVSQASTLYVPPLGRPRPDPARVGLFSALNPRPASG
jgi:uncharacterized protein YabN with tetrapyrrole methylase and pyrophosphatase domain